MLQKFKGNEMTKEQTTSPLWENYLDSSRGKARVLPRHEHQGNFLSLRNELAWKFVSTPSNLQDQWMISKYFRHHLKFQPITLYKLKCVIKWMLNQSLLLCLITTHAKGLWTLTSENIRPALYVNTNFDVIASFDCKK